MKRYWTAAAAVALLYASAPRTSAMTFLPVVSGPEVDAAAPNGTAKPTTPGMQLASVARPSQLRVSLQAGAWSMPSVSVSGVTGVAGDRIQFSSQVMPIVAAEYRVSRYWGVGGWFNPANTDFKFKGPTAELLTAGPNPRIPSARLATGSLNMWSAHVARFFPRNIALQAGIMNYHGAVSAWVPNPRQPGNLLLNAAQGGTEVQVWGYKSYRIWGYSGHQAFFTGGLGVRRRISKESGNVGPAVTGNASATFSYFPKENVSIDVSTWFADFTHQDASTLRLNGGVTGHF